MNDAQTIRQSINKYYLFEFLIDCAFFGPVILVFWQRNGLSFTQIMMLQASYALTSTLLELPTGAFADHIGKKISLMIGALFFSAGCFWYGFSHTFWQFFLGELITGTGMAFISGADRAYIHQLLCSEKRGHEFSRIDGRSRGLSQIAVALSSVLGGLIGSVSLGLTLIATSAVTFVGFLVGASFPKVKVTQESGTKPNLLQTIYESIKIIKHSPTLLWLTLFFAFFNALIWPLQLFAQAYLLHLQIPISLFGIIFMVFNLVAAGGLALTHWYERLTKKHVFMIMSVAVVIALFLLGRFPSIYLFPLWLCFIVFGIMSQTIISSRVLRIAPAHRTATILSFQSMLRRILYAGIGPMFGFTIDKLGMPVALQLYALAASLILGGLLMFKGKEI